MANEFTKGVAMINKQGDIEIDGKSVFLNATWSNPEGYANASLVATTYDAATALAERGLDAEKVLERLSEILTSAGDTEWLQHVLKSCEVRDET